MTTPGYAEKSGDFSEGATHSLREVSRVLSYLFESQG